MPRPQRVPSYTLHKPTGQARVILGGRHLYLGPFGSPASREKYAQLIAEHYRPGAAPLPPAARAAGDVGYPELSNNELFLRYLDYATAYYTVEGTPTGELENMKDAMRSVRTLYAHDLARAFGPRALKAVQGHMIRTEKLSRNVINARINRVRRIYRWAVSEELLPPGAYEALRAVPGLRYGRCDAREARPVRPVAEEWIESTVRFLPPQVADMVRLQRATGMRPGSVVTLRWCDLDRSGGDDVWIFAPPAHKTTYLGKRLLIPIGPRAQEILSRYEGRSPDAYIRSPREVEAWRQEQRRHWPGARRTPVYPSEQRRLARERAARRRRRRKREPGERYTTDSYRRAVEYGIKKANAAGVTVPSWHPNQLRHNRGTEVRKQFGIEGAQVVLGHSKANVTEVYAERNLDLAKQIARKTG
jgi:integrase